MSQKKHEGGNDLKHECPLGGDINNNCDGCFYSGEYYYDYDIEDCIRRPKDNEIEGRRS